MSYVYGIDKTKSSTQFGLLPPKLKSELNSTIATMLTILLKQHGVASVFTCITAYTCSHNSHCERVLFDSLFALICSRLLLLLVARHYCLLGLLHTVFGLFGIQMRLIWMCQENLIRWFVLHLITARQCPKQHKWPFYGYNYQCKYNPSHAPCITVLMTPFSSSAWRLHMGMGIVAVTAICSQELCILGCWPATV